MHIDQYLNCSLHQQASCKESDVSSLFNWAYSIITNKDYLNKESITVKQMLKENGYQWRNISNIFNRVITC